MPYSYNGWFASPDLPNIEMFTIPGTTRQVYLNKYAAPILLHAAAGWDREVEPIDQGQLDDWGANFRLTTDGDSLSCHASGTAADINALKYPRGTNNMSAEKQTKVRRIIADINAISLRVNGKRLLNWGGEWSGEYKDQMHIELARDTDRYDVARVMAEIRGDWLTMATKAEVKAVVKEAIAEMEPTIQRICQEAVQAELGDGGSRVLSTQLVDPQNSDKTYTAGSWIRGRDVALNRVRDEILAALKP